MSDAGAYPPAAGPVGGRPRIADETPVDGAWVWVVALLTVLSLPMLLLINVDDYIRVSLGLDSAATMDALGAVLLNSLLLSALGFAMLGLTVFAAYRDHARLRSLGVVRPFHWAFAFLGALVYLIGRHVVLRKVMRTIGWPLWVNVFLNVVVFTAAIIWAMWFLQMVLTAVMVGLYAS